MASLREGDSSTEVAEVQQRLVDLGYFVGAIDGDFGPITAAAVGYFQSTHGLVIDRVVGDVTREILGMQPISGIGNSIAVTVVWPEADVWNPGDEIVVQVEPQDASQSPTEVWVTMVFRGPGGEETVSQLIEIEGGSVSLARLELPDAAAMEGEVYFSGYVYHESEDDFIAEGHGSFRVDLPDEV